MDIPLEGGGRKQEKSVPATHPAGVMDRTCAVSHDKRFANPYCELGTKMRTLLILAAVLAPAGVGSAQTKHPVASSASSEWKAGNCESPFRLSLLKPMPGFLHEPDTLPELRELLRNSREPHDAYIRVAKIGNEETVPLLLTRLRLDYGVSEPMEFPGKVRGIIDTQAHLIDALRSITNTDQGYYYPRWAAWWGANQTFPGRSG